VARILALDGHGITLETPPRAAATDKLRRATIPLDGGDCKRLIRQEKCTKGGIGTCEAIVCKELGCPRSNPRKFIKKSKHIRKLEFGI
jgi:hypothetical protein